MRLPIERIDQPGQESPFAFPCDTITALTAPQPGVEQVPHRIAEHVEGVDDQRQENPWPQGQPRRHLHVLTSFPAEHPSPTWKGGGKTESQETQRGLSNDDPANVDREDDDDRRHDIGQDMADQDLDRGGCPRPWLPDK